MKLRNKKTGEIVEFRYLQSDYIAPLVLTTYENDKPEMYTYNSLADLNEEWEDYEEPKVFYIIDLDGEILPSDFQNETIEKSKKLGNYFNTKEEAEKAVERLHAWKRLKDKGFRLNAVVDTFFCIDIFIKGKQYEEIKDDLKIVFGDEE